MGGDFGGKASLMDIPLCYSLAKATGRPVKMIMSYSEELTAANPRHPALITIKIGLKRDARLWAREVRVIFSSGVYAGFKNSENVNLPGARHGAGLISFPISRSTRSRFTPIAFRAGSCARLAKLRCCSRLKATPIFLPRK